MSAGVRFQKWRGVTVKTTRKCLDHMHCRWKGDTVGVVVGYVVRQPRQCRGTIVHLQRHGEGGAFYLVRDQHGRQSYWPAAHLAAVSR